MDEQLYEQNGYAERENLARQKVLARKRDVPVKIVFILQQFTFWHNYSSPIKELSTMRGKFSPVVLSLPMTNFCEELAHLSDPLEELTDIGVPVLRQNKYDIYKEKPDLVFFHDPYSFHRNLKYHPAMLALRDTLSAIIPYCTEFIGPAHFTNQYFGPDIHLIWRNFTSSYMASQVHQVAGIPEWGVPVAGNPEYDHIINSRPDELSKSKKITGMAAVRKIVLWTPHYTNNESGWGTWGTMGLELLRLFREYAGKLFFVIRPHPILRGSLECWKPGKAPESRIEEIASLVHESEDLWLDDDNLAIESVHAADAVVSDMSSLLTKSMALGKSVMYTYGKEGSCAGAAAPILTRYVHNSTDVEGVRKFLDMIACGENDPLLPLPQLVKDAFCGPVDGMAGKRIAAYLENYFFPPL